MSYEFDFTFLNDYWPDLWLGIQQTAWMTLVSIVPGFALGTAAAVARLYGPPMAQRIVTIYVEGIRNTPLVIQVFWLFFGLAVLGARIGPFNAAVIALVINVGAYTAEIMRAGFQSIPRGQLEAASCLAMSRRQMFFNVQLPQAVERVYPALVSQFILMMLATSIMSQISANELTGVAYQIQSFTFRGFEVYLVIAVIYLVLASALRLLLHGVAQAAFPRLRRLKTPL
ncbi:amino acid ABC transporter permease [Aureimonas frigidaquae]|uniref:Polar amino acid ABC transporter inner membrane subunit n=1 Tax=Aureimonas frigidaquae TaxID=424757 RepID=A0A0N7KXX0_9HYPH|nr:amino acid ABC transporter permease [Aureimonas frigidaquae]BAT28097.1 polar amino acid ABC transporter inner membrane subunit [Aureimonas frigidaquae]